MAWFEVNSHSLLHLILFVVAQVSTATVPKCTDLGVSITETTIDSVLVGIWWLGHDNKVVYVQSNSYLVYRSTDEGRTWAQQNYKFNGKLLSHVIPTANPSKVYFLGIYGEWGVWRSSDAGETVVYDSTYSGYNRGIIFNMIYPHPYKEDFAIAWGYNEACNTGGPDPCGTNLFYTSNFGVEWHLVDTFTEEFTWAATELVEPDTSTNLVTILYTAWENKTIPSPYRDPTKYNLQVLRTDITHHTDSSADRITKSTVAEWTLGLFKSPENETVVFYYTPDSEGGQSLYVSEDDGETWNQAVFPTELQEHGWSVIDDAEGAVFLNVQGSSGATYGHVYSSQAWGEDYTVILKNNKRSSLGGVWGAADFIRVESMDGVYLANQYITDNINSHKPPSENDPVQSVITFDMGGSWHRLTPPANSCNNCFLHLNGPEESVYGRFYSIPAAVGVIVGTGNVGTHLNDSSVNTYLSRDAGVSWQEIQKGSWAYEIGDHGGILLLAPQSSEANGIVPGIANNTVLYSKDEGLNFQTCQFTDQTMQIYNMVIEPSSTSEVFILYGTRDESGVLAFIDFKNTYSRACQYPEKAGSASSDYELWSPTDPYSSSDCMLGRKTYYTRRKRDVNCYNPQEYETIVNSTNCPCTLEDYECDYCFEPDTSGSCVQICEQEIECNEEGYYMKSQGYRPIAGDTCDLKSGVDLMPIKTKCSSGHSDSGSSSGGGNVAGIVVAIIFVILAAGAAIGFVLYVYKYQKPDWVYERIFANRAHGNDYSSLNVDAMDEEPSTMFDESILTDTRVDEI